MRILQAPNRLEPVSWDFLRNHATQSALLFAGLAVALVAIALGFIIGVSGPELILGFMALVGALISALGAVSLELSRRRSARPDVK
jgi:uncharacterized membrane protein